jgi:dolichol-phosphate mannosyltransferase
MLLSVVSPLKNEAPNVERLVAALRTALGAAGLDYELVLVDDGSSDATWDHITEEGKRGPVRGVRLARSFGQQAAILAGLAAAGGDLVAVMDADLQDPPELVPKLVQEQEKTGAALVLARRGAQRDVGWFKRVTSVVFTGLLGRISEHPIHRNVGDFYLMRRDVAAALIRATEHGGPAFLRGDLGWIGAETVAVTFDRSGRPAGRTKYDFGKMRRFAWDGITSASLAPLRIPYLLAWVAAFVLAGFVVGGATGVVPWGIAVICATMTAACAAILVSIGVLGEYLGRVHRMARGRPPYWVAATSNLPAEREGRLAGRVRGE